MSNSTSRGGGWRFLSLYLQRNLPFLLLLTSRCLHAHLRAQVREGAALALRAARRADAPAVLDERVADPGPAVPRDDPVEVALGARRAYPRRRRPAYPRRFRGRRSPSCARRLAVREGPPSCVGPRRHAPTRGPSPCRAAISLSR